MDSGGGRAEQAGACTTWTVAWRCACVDPFTAVFASSRVFCIQHKPPVEGLYEVDNTGGSGEVEDKACCRVLDDL